MTQLVNTDYGHWPPTQTTRNPRQRSPENVCVGGYNYGDLLKTEALSVVLSACVLTGVGL